MSHNYGQKETQPAAAAEILLDVSNDKMWSRTRIDDEITALEASLAYAVEPTRRAGVLHRLSVLAFESEMRDYEILTPEEHVSGEPYDFTGDEFPLTVDATDRLDALRGNGGILSQAFADNTEVMSTL
jgi:hypothetical protein